MPITDYLEALGTGIGELGVAKRGHTPAAVTGLASALTGFATGAKIKRAQETGRALVQAKRDFEAKVGVNYDIFAKLPSDAQESILKRSGVVPDPYSQTPLDQFGGRTAEQLETQGAPGRTAPASGTGVFEGLGGLPVGNQQVGPDLPPLGLLGKSGTARAGAVQSYLGQGTEIDPTKQSLIDYRKNRLDQFEREMADRALLRKSQRDRNAASIKAMKALTDRRSKPDEPIDPWEVTVGRSMGLMIPKGVTPTRSQYNNLLKFNKPAMAVVGRIDDLAQDARKAEITAGKNFNDKLLAEWVARHTSDIPALAGDTAPALVLQGVKEQLKVYRAAPSSFFTPASGEGDGESDQIPGELEDDEEPDEDADDEDYR